MFQRDYRFTESLTFYIIIANLAVWILQLITYPFVNDFFALDPSMAFSGSIYQFFTYMFLHATYARTAAGVVIYPAHIMINMLVLAIFGFPLEQTLGRKRFIIVYVLSGIGSAVFYVTMMSVFMGTTDVSLLGASGAVFGVLTAYAFKYPKNWIYLLGFFPMPAAAMIVFLLIEETLFGFMGLDPGVANFGHVGGIITGLIIMVFWRITERERGFGQRDWEFVWE